MLKNRTEYTPGQMIRFEAVALHHNAASLQEIMLASRPELDFLGPPAAAAMASLKKDLQGEPGGINRKQEHYDNLMETLERAREQVESRPVSENTQRAWHLLNRCRYHCMTIRCMMERSTAVTGTDKAPP